MSLLGGPALDAGYRTRSRSRHRRTQARCAPSYPSMALGPQDTRHACPPHTQCSHTISSHTRLGSRTSQRKGKGAPVGARTAPHSHTTTPQTAYSGSRYARKSLKCSLLSPPLGNAAFPSGSIHGRVLAAHHHLSHARASRLPLSAAPAPVRGLSCAGSPFRSDAQIANASWRPLHAGRTLLLRPPPLSSRLSLIPLSL